MKHLLVLFTLLFASSIYAQSGSINYKAVIKDNGGNVVASQAITIQFQILEGGTLNVYQETHNPTTDANGIIIVNIGEGAVNSGDFSTINWGNDDHFLNVQVNIGGGLIDLGTTQFRAVPYALSAGNVAGLEALDEGNGIGWRLKGKDPANYDNIGLNSVDLSTSNSTSVIRGASGDYATAMGRNTVASASTSTAMGSNTIASGSSSTAMGTNTLASGAWSTAMGLGSQASGDQSTSMGGGRASGKYSTAMGLVTEASAYASLVLGRNNFGGGNPTDWVETDPLFEIGNGSIGANKSNALTVLKNGTITAPSFDLIEITDSKALITKEYADANLEASGLEAIDEGNGIGWRLKGKDSTFYANIGTHAVDLSDNGSANDIFGASGVHSFAVGALCVASGNYSTAIGFNAIATGDYSVSFGRSQANGTYSYSQGFQSLAQESFSVAIGSSVSSNSRYEVVFGRYNSSYNPIDPSGWHAEDRIFSIGNGSSNTARSNAVTILKGGKVGFGEDNPTAFLEVSSINSATEPTMKLVHEGTTGARINFTDTGVTNGNRWTLYGDADDNDAVSVFNIFHPNKGNILRIHGDGEVGINGAPDTDFHIFHGNNGIASGMKLENSSNNAWWRFYVSSGSDDLRLYSASQGTTIIGAFDDISGAYTSSSDRRLKKNFEALHFTWNDFMELETLTYNYKVQKDNKKHIGLVAQDVESIYPELVQYNEDDDVYHLNYSGFGVVAIKAIQEQQKIITNQASRIEVLEAKLSEKETAHEQLNQRLNTIEKVLNRLQ